MTQLNNNFKHARRNRKPEMKEITEEIEWEYAPHYIYEKYDYSMDEILNKDVPTWDKLKEKHGITIRSPVQ